MACRWYLSHISEDATEVGTAESFSLALGYQSTTSANGSWPSRTMTTSVADTAGSR